MNILCYGVRKLGKMGTESVHIYEVLSNLAKLGYNLILADVDRPLDTKEISPETSLRWWTRLERRSLPVTILASFLDETRTFIFHLAAILKQKAKPEVVYMRHTLLGGGYLLARLLGIPVVKEVNGIVTDEIKVARQGTRVSLWLLDRIERFTLPKADKIISVTSRMKDVLQSDYGIAGDKIVVIQNGANTDLFKPIDALEARAELNLEPDSSYICYVGSFSRYQGIEYLIESAPFILSECPGAKFLIVGEGTMKEELLSLVKKMGLVDKFVFAGKVSYEKVPIFINASDVCVAPKKPLPCGYSPLKLYEYMACGKPVVATRTDGFEILEEHNAGLLIDPENPRELADAITKVLQKPELGKQMGKNGRDCVVEKHSWGSIARRVAEVCERAVAEKRGSQSEK